MAELYLSMDDTDDLESPGTGKVLAGFRMYIEENGLGKTEGITRHQLYVHRDIPYTSHNSSMCFSMVTDGNLPWIRGRAAKYLEEVSVEDADPGLGILDLAELKNREALVRFGLAAKKSILSKDEAYRRAEECGVYLSEHGGTGEGVIGALAAIALRLEGNDGRFRGALSGLPAGGEMTVGELQNHPAVDDIFVVQSGALSGKGRGEIISEICGKAERPAHDTKLILDEKVKTVRINHRSVLLLRWDFERMCYINWTKEDLKIF